MPLLFLGFVMLVVAIGLDDCPLIWSVLALDSYTRGFLL